MSKLRKMHILGGTLTLTCILWNISKIMEAFKVDWQNGTSLLSTLAIGGYLLGCIVSGAITLAYSMFKDKKQKKTS
ncbi:MAG: hypothetical protein EBY39_15000 [Flavobacteriia bacterium]|nr:hypothetical protein [Flavobacteriia bacterium]